MVLPVLSKALLNSYNVDDRYVLSYENTEYIPFIRFFSMCCVCVFSTWYYILFFMVKKIIPFNIKKVTILSIVRI